MDWKLELVGLPVSDIDRAKAFYVDQVGFVADHDHTVSDEIRFVQITPPGSACSIAFGRGISAAEPGSVDALQLVVDDVEQARAELVSRGVEVSDVEVFPGVRSSTSATPTATPGPSSRSHPDDLTRDEPRYPRHPTSRGVMIDAGFDELRRGHSTRGCVVLEYTVVDGEQVAFERRGRGEPLVLLHGLPGDRRIWRRQLAGLADEFTVMASDSPGSGRSWDPPGSFGVTEVAGWLLGFIEALDLDRPHVVGLSWGSGVALALYRLAPGVPSSIVLSSGYAGWAGSLPADVVADDSMRT